MLKEIEIKVEPHSSSMKYYVIRYRPKMKINWFNYWRTLVEVWDGASLSFDQPVMYDSFDDAISIAKKFKENPSLIDKHYKNEREKYMQSKKRRDDYYKSRNKTQVI